MPITVAVLALACAAAAAASSVAASDSFTSLATAAAGPYVFYSHWEQNCDPGHTTDSYNFTRCGYAANGNGSFVNCVDFFNFGSQIDGVLYTVGSMVADAGTQV